MRHSSLDSNVSNACVKFECRSVIPKTLKMGVVPACMVFTMKLELGVWLGVVSGLGNLG